MDSKGAEMTAHLLFEQSGTFKNAFKKNGVEAFDYDIQNEFGETDYILDLFKEIEGGYQGKQSIFDSIKSDDIVIAFFPCTRFEARIPLAFRGQMFQQKNWDDIQKLEYAMNLHDELNEYYKRISELVIVCERKNIRLIIENPYTAPHYLTMYWCIKPTIIDKDRTKDGDYYKKPTQYFFINVEPKDNLVFEPLEHVERKTISHVKGGGRSRQTERSMIHPQYADRFIRKFIL